ncbi:serine protease inhibitor 88Ea [Procambarus clarkii]|uniref:Serine proteinase inhibitor n=1 Tax=Procambarus clarkii TaxID=6728 RepID=A0A8B0M691_PROCL|nr:serine protease inhibitor 88Ea-like [Procambarus clarkii]QTW21149.1 serine proteinase inhibitor [Procambarus clarkii]
MQGGVVLVVLALVAGARPQCLSENDNLDIPASSDLSPITDFGLELFKGLFPYNSTTRNFFFSPYSVWNALTLAYFGSGGETQLQLEEALRVTDKVTTLKNWRALEFLYRMRQANNSDYTFNLANRAFFDKTVSLRTCMDAILHNELQVLDFSQATEAANEINNFVSETTKGRINTLVEPADVSQAKMVLANAAFFKGTWLYQFKPSQTRKNLFYATPEDYYFVDMMTQKGNFRHGVSEELGAHILELPYTGEAVSMYILLPPFISGENGFNAMVERLNASLLHEAFNNMWRMQVEVIIPKFKLEQLIENELMVALAGMGVTDLFDQRLANLTAFVPSGSLSIGKSIHKAFVEVSEEGTEAAAATALISWRIARPVGPEKFECNHPFLFIIYDNLTKNVLFLGAYKNPKA